jgi:3,4-dihydroxy 2-butanone 4-phosphate synthase/GTP cyclohydrolase II
MTRPEVTLAYAQSLDGCLAAAPGRPTALSGPESKALTHRLRAQHDAILVGVGTVLADDPQLTVRLAQGDHPQPIILDSYLRTPPESFLASAHPRRAWIACLAEADPRRGDALRSAGAQLLPLPPGKDGRPSLPVLLEALQRGGIQRLMVEGGAQVLTAFLAQRLANRVCITIAPRFLGGLHAIQSPLAHLPPLQDIRYESVGADLIVWAKT